MKQTLLKWCVCVGWTMALVFGMSGCNDSDYSKIENTADTDTRGQWMQPCIADDGCDSDAQCLCGVCTLPCQSDDACTDAGPQAACVMVNSSNALSAACDGMGPAAAGVCLAECAADGDCSSLGEGFACVAGQCVPETPSCLDEDGDGLTTCDGDCNDADPNTNLQEVCGDGLDNNCDGIIDEGCTDSRCRADGDCPDGFACTAAGTCAPAEPSDEVCGDGIDNDGDGVVDEGCGADIDSDGDGISDTSDNCPWAANSDQADLDGDGTGDVCDCDADDASISPTADEVCRDALDNNCNGTIDEGCTDSRCRADGDCPDGLACTAAGTCAPIEPSDEVCGDDIDNDGDGAVDEGCGDGDPNTNLQEVCGDDLDNDGDGAVDEGCGDGNEDSDGDGISDASDNCPQIPNPDQIDLDGDGAGDVCDCGADDASISPTADEVCRDAVDNNCDGTIDEGCADSTCRADEDCPEGSTCSSARVCVPLECADTEMCGDGLDNDCDGIIDEGC